MNANRHLKRTMYFLIFASVALLMAVGVRQLLVGYQRVPTSLDYDGTRNFRIANRNVTVETKSLSLGNGDQGDAEIIVSSGGKTTILASSFSDDNWTYIKPAYISWENVDGHSGRDLLIWKPSLTTHGTLAAEEFISSEDGALHLFQIPLERPMPGL